MFHSCATVRDPNRGGERERVRETERREGRKYKMLIVQTLARELYAFVVWSLFLFSLFVLAPVCDVSLPQSRTPVRSKFSAILRAASFLCH
jgi:hypothetical protein